MYLPVCARTAYSINFYRFCQYSSQPHPIKNCVLEKNTIFSKDSLDYNLQWHFKHAIILTSLIPTLYM